MTVESEVARALRLVDEQPLVVPGDHIVVSAPERSPLLSPLRDRLLLARGEQGRLTVVGPDGIDLRWPGDPLGYVVVDTGARSWFEPVSRRAPRFRFPGRNARAPVKHHAHGRHEYSLPRTVLDADVIVSLCAIAPHQRLGLAPALASALRLTGDPAWLPHYTAGAPGRDGDEFPFRPPHRVRIETRIARLRGRTPEPSGHVVEGCWHANDTLWRAALDLDFILSYADRDGTLAREPQRRRLAIVG